MGNHQFPNLGGETVLGQSENGKTMKVEFNIADISRPILSIGELIGKSNRAVFDSDPNYIENTNTGAWIPLRLDNNLFYSDMWCQMPGEIDSSTLARQAQP